jgi:hypothetical protein
MLKIWQPKLGHAALHAPQKVRILLGQAVLQQTNSYSVSLPPHYYSSPCRITMALAVTDPMNVT